MYFSKWIPPLFKHSGTAICKEGATEAATRNFRPPWKAKSVWVAMVMVLMGSVLYLKDLRSHAPQVSQEKESISMNDQAAPQKESGADLPATLRLGVSYIGGFLIGWGFRRFIRLSLLVSTAAFALVALGRKTGWIDLDWSLLENQVHQAATWFEGEASTLKALLESYLPSAGSAGVGAVLGFRRK